MVERYFGERMEAGQGVCQASGVWSAEGQGAQDPIGLAHHVTQPGPGQMLADIVDPGYLPSVWQGSRRQR